MAPVGPMSRLEGQREGIHFLLGSHEAALVRVSSSSGGGGGSVLKGGTPYGVLWKAWPGKSHSCKQSKEKHRRADWEGFGFGKARGEDPAVGLTVVVGIPRCTLWYL